MAKIAYVERKWVRKEVQGLIDKIDLILRENYANGYRLGIRAIYYQLRRRGWIVIPPNDKNRTYNRIKNIVSTGRMAGLLDWDMVIDGSRSLRSFAGGFSPDEMAGTLNSIVDSYREDLWADQEYHVELWVEKNTLDEACIRPARAMGVGLFSCHGYNSLSEMRRAALRLHEIAEPSEPGVEGKKVLVLYVGDHDPSGLHIPENVRQMVDTFTFHSKVDIEIRRIILTKEQIKEFKCLPEVANPNDPRFADYKKKNGNKSWEVESLDYLDIDKIIRKHIDEVIDHEKWEAAELREARNHADIKDKWSGAMHYMKHQDEISEVAARVSLDVARRSDLAVARTLQPLLDLVFPDPSTFAQDQADIESESEAE